MGELNFCTQVPHQSNNFSENDELTKEILDKKIFIGYKEEKITFQPLDTPRKSDAVFPSRILYQSASNGLTQKCYKSYPSFGKNDYNPVYGVFEFDSSLLNVPKIISPLSNKKKVSKKKEGMIVQKSLETTHWELSDFEFKDRIITSDRYTVYKVLHRSSNRYFAAKIYKETNNELQEEIELMLEIDSQFMIKYYKVFNLKDFIVVIVDLIENEDLYGTIKKRRLSEDDAKFYIGELLLVLKKLHKLNIVHRDLRPENIKLSPEGHVKLAGFHYSKVILTRTFTKCGTLDYISPEVILNIGHNKGVDYWSLGILTFELLCGYPPFHSFDSEYQQINSILDGKLKMPGFLSSSAKDFICQLLKKNKSLRLGCLKGGVDDIMNHSWFKGLNWEKLERLEIKAPFTPNKIQYDPKVHDSLFDEFQQIYKGEETPKKLKFEWDFLPSPKPKILSLDIKSNEKFGRIKTSQLRKCVSLYEGDIVKIVNLENENAKCEVSDTVVDVPINEVEEVVMMNQKYVNKKRIDILNEFLLTERSYVESLKILIQEYFQPTLTILSPEIHQKIFSSIQTIYKVNSTFLDILEKSLQKEDFLNQTPKSILLAVKSFKLYASYIQNYNIAFKTINVEKDKNSKFEKFLKTVKTNLNLSSYLIMPVQRLPRYKLLCEDLLKSTPDEEKEVVEKLTEEVKEIVIYCNGKAKEFEESFSSFQYQRKFKLAIDNSQALLLEKKPSEMLFIIEKDKYVPLNEFAILSGLILAETKTKQIKLEFDKFDFNNYSASHNKKGFEILGKGNEKFVFVIDDENTLKRFNEKLNSIKAL